MSSTFDFKQQLAVGNKGEKWFTENYHSPLVLIPEHYADFKRISDGRIVELKTDTYSLAKTPNFFIERYSDFHKKSPGGIWQSKEKRVQVFCYLFINDGVYYEFDLRALVKELTPIADELEAKGKFRWIKNRAWVTAGFPYPREKLKHLYKEYRVTPQSSDSSADVSGNSAAGDDGPGSKGQG